MFEMFLGIFQNKDEDLNYVLLAKEGDINSFEVLVKKHQKNVINYAFRILNNIDDALDLAQEVFLIVYKKIKSFKGDSKFSTWLYRITSNLSKNYLKKKKSCAHQAIDKKFEIAIDDPLPSEKMERQELREKVLKALDLLSNEFKEIIILRDIEGLSYEEIGYILKIPQGTVKSRIARARQCFMEILKGGN